MYSINPGTIGKTLAVSILVLLVMTRFSNSAHAQNIASDKSIPPGGVALLPSGAVSAFGTYSYPGTASVQLVTLTGQPYPKALRLTTLKQPTNAWDMQASTATVASIKKGDICLAVFAMRVLQSGSGYGRTNIILEDGTSYSKTLWFEASAGGDWKTFYAPFTALQDEPAGQAHVNLHMGFPAQTIEVANIHITDYADSVKLSDLPQTQYSYAGRALDAPWRKAAAARIDKYRKGDFVIKVLDAHGKPVPGAAVRVRQVRHAFGFGTSVDNIFLRDTPESAQYRTLTYSLFNEAVPGRALKAREWENSGHEYDQHSTAYTRADALRLVNDLIVHNLTVRGHNLVWPSWGYSPQLEPLKSDPSALSEHIVNHIKDEVGALRGQCLEWDVVNEPYNNHDIQDVLGPHCLVDWFNAAHVADPAARLYLNDFGTTENNGEDHGHIDGYCALIKYLLDNHAPLGGIGLESHFGRILTPPDRVYAIMSQFARFGLPLEVTEFDVNVPDQQLQADYLRDYMTIAFSHPAVSGFVMWGFWAGDHWIPDAALFRQDFSIKPNGLVYRDLVFRQWWTDTHGRSDSSGTYRTRAFLGDYQITAAAGGKTVIVPARVIKNGVNITTVFIRMAPSTKHPVVH